MKRSTPFNKFDDAMRKVLSVSHEELKAREGEWKKQKKGRKKKAKS